MGDQMVATLMTTQRLYLQARQIWEEWRPIMRQAAARPGAMHLDLRDLSLQMITDKAHHLSQQIYDETVRSMDASDREPLAMDVVENVKFFLHRQFKDWSKEAEREQQQS